MEINEHEEAQNMHLSEARPLHINAQRRKTHERYRSVARIITHSKETDRSKTHMSNRLPWVTLTHTHTGARSH